MMKQMTIISGKGGTGKTTLAAAFASLATGNIFADCDVDAADLHLIFDPTILTTQPFTGLDCAQLDEERCIGCGRCFERCRFDAVVEHADDGKEEGASYSIDPMACEGCGVCAYVCPTDAITMQPRTSGKAYHSKSRFGPLFHATLKIAEEASGKLIALVRDLARKYAEKEGRDLILIDGAPGIGCPVIAAISGVDLVTVVTEPTLSGIHDLERVLGVAAHFDIDAGVIINKCDINDEMTDRIARYCEQNDISLFGTIPYDTAFTDAMIQGKTLIEYADEGDALAARVEQIWETIRLKLT